MKILVTGGAGFIGSYLTEYLLGKGHEVIVWDDLSTGRQDNLKNVYSNKNLQMIKENILNYYTLESGSKGCDIIFHLAAQLEILEMMDDPSIDLTVNGQGTLNVLEAAKTNKVKKVVFASTCGVYGEPKYIPVDEKHVLEPQWHYGASKILGEKYCGVYSKLYNIQTIILRYGYIYGPREWFGRVHTRFINRILDNKNPLVFVPGTQTRDFLNVIDCARITAELGLRCIPSSIFNVSSGNKITISKLAKLLIEISNKDLEIKMINPEPYKMGRKPCELKHVQLDINKLKHYIDDQIIDLYDGLVSEYEWAKKYRHIYWRNADEKYNDFMY